MKKLFLAIAIAFSISASAQGVSVDTAAQRKQQEEANKFIGELVTKTSIKDFQAWLVEMNVGVKDFEVFSNLYNGFIRQKYTQHLQSKEQPKK